MTLANIQIGLPYAYRTIDALETAGNFFSAGTRFVEMPENANSVMLSSSADGTGKISTDDQVVLEIFEPDQSGANGTRLFKFSYDFSISGGVATIDPIDLMTVSQKLPKVIVDGHISHALNRNVNILLACNDLYGGGISSTEYWLTFT